MQEHKVFVAHGDVCFHAIRVLALRDDDDALLDGPAEHHLGLGGAEPRRDALHGLVAEERRELLAGHRAPERRVRSENDVVLSAVLSHRLEGQAGVQLDLVRDRDDSCLGEESLQKRDTEVRNADGLDLACRDSQYAKEISTRPSSPVSSSFSISFHVSTIVGLSSGARVRPSTDACGQCTRKRSM
jgi:hypothetical protein